MSYKMGYLIYKKGKNIMVKLNFEFEKETKGTIRFKEISDDPVVGTLYIKKTHLDELGIKGAGDKLLIIIDKVQ